MNKRLIIEIKNGSELTRNDPGGPRQTVRGMEFRVGENARNLTASAGHLFPAIFLKMLIEGVPDQVLARA